MRGRGLLLAAAIVQLVGAAIFLFTGIAQIALGGAFLEQRRGAPLSFLALGAAIIAVAAVYVVISIFLIRARRLAWIASLALDSLSAAAFLLLPFGGVGVGEFLILLIFALPLFVTIGLLIGGRHAVLASSAKTAAEPISVTPSRDA